MKLTKKDFDDNDGKGAATLIAEESEDLWHLYNLVAEGDVVRAMTYRKVQREDGKGSESKKLRLTIDVEKIEYDTEGDNIRFSGKVCEENEWVKLGARHTIEIELNTPITLTKVCWDSVFRQQLEDATDITKTAEVAVVLIEAKDAGNANVQLLTNVRAKRVANIQHTLPKKKITSTQLDKAMVKFFEALYEGVTKHIDFSVVKCVVLAGPGSAKDDFGKWMQTHAMQQGNSEILQKKGIFLTVDTKSIHNEGMAEIFADEQVQKRIANTRAGLHIKTLEELQKRLSNEPDRACYGPKQVKRALRMGAIDVMCICDSLFRNTTLIVRKEYVDLVSEVKDSGSKAYVFSSAHISGQELEKLAGIAATLRYPLEDEEEDEHETAAVVDAPKPADCERSEAVQKPELKKSVSGVASKSAAQTQSVAALMVALDNKASEERIEQVLAEVKGRTEDAFLILLGEELDGTGPKFAPPARDESKTAAAASSAAAAPIATATASAATASKPAAATTAAPAAKAVATPAAKAGGKAAAKPAGKPAAKKKPQKAAMQWDEYDNY